MKKYIVLVICMVFSACGYGSTESDQLVIQMTNAATDAFGNFKMFDQPVSDEGLWKWNAAINGAQKSIAVANKKNKKVADYSARIDKANSQFIHAVNEVGNTLFLPYEGKKQLTDEQKRTFKIQYDALIKRFNSVKDDMVTLIKEVKSSRLFELGIEKKDLIFSLADTIMRYATNAIASLEFKVSIDNRFSRSRTF